jgi:hypothetical protein
MSLIRSFATPRGSGYHFHLEREMLSLLPRHITAPYFGRQNFFAALAVDIVNTMRSSFDLQISNIKMFWAAENRAQVEDIQEGGFVSYFVLDYGIDMFFHLYVHALIINKA